MLVPPHLIRHARDGLIPSPEVMLPIGLRYIRKDVWHRVLTREENIRKKMLKLVSDTRELLYNSGFPKEYYKQELYMLSFFEGIFKEPLFSHYSYIHPFNLAILEFWLSVAEYSIATDVIGKDDKIVSIIRGFLEEEMEIHKKITELRILCLNNLVPELSKSSSEVKSP